MALGSGVIFTISHYVVYPDFHLVIEVPEVFESQGC